MIWFVLISLVVLWIVAVTVLLGPDLRHYDVSVGDVFEVDSSDGEVAKQVLRQLQLVRKDVVKNKSLKKGLTRIRQFADQLSADLETDTVFSETIIHGIGAEWAVAAGANPKRRVLFLHGGAFIFGSPKGHRKFSDKLSKIAKAAVLSVDYRLLPENGRYASIVDAQRAYHWILNNGPTGEAPLEFLLVTGDSAGGNLALMLSSWSKRNAARRPNAVIGFSPSCDMTMASPTNRSNRRTDKILGEGLGRLAMLPSPIRAWAGLFFLRMNPSNKLASPLFGDLAELPPTLIQASSNEMLLGEAVRYTNRAIAMGSNVKLQIWDDQLHDWHLFNMGHGSANAAWKQVSVFLDNLNASA